MVPLRDPGAVLSEAERAALAAELGPLTTLEAVVRWGYAASPPRAVADVVVQDEYTHDVALPLRGEVHLVFDTT